MDREYYSEAGQSQNTENQASSGQACVPNLSGRMKHLLIGVRLSVALTPVEPANDLEALASRIDRMRAARNRDARDDSRSR